MQATEAPAPLTQAEADTIAMARHCELHGAHLDAPWIKPNGEAIPDEMQANMRRRGLLRFTTMGGRIAPTRGGHDALNAHHAAA